MKNCLHPSPSKIVMTALLGLHHGKGTSIEDIVNFAKDKYGLTDTALKNRIAGAMRRGVKYNILYKENGLFYLNEGVGKAMSSTGGAGQHGRKRRSVTGGRSGDDKGDRKRRRLLCPECQIKEEKLDPAEEEEKRSRYNLRPRKSTPSAKQEEYVETGKPVDEYRRIPWKDFFKIRNSLERQSCVKGVRRK